MFTLKLFRITLLIMLWLTIIPTMAQTHVNPVTSECWFTALQDIPTYNDSAFVQRHATQVMLVGTSLRVTQADGDALLVVIDHAMGFWVDGRLGRLSGECDDIAQITATLLTNAWVWSFPDVTQGEIAFALAEGTTVSITGGHVLGRIRYDTLETDVWYPIRYGDQIGWMWAGRLDITDTTLPDADAFALDNARMWSQPDVNTGEVLQDLPVNTPLDIIGGPVVGRIRYDDTTVTGVWYQVMVDGVIGWIWENRLRFE